MKIIRLLLKSSGKHLFLAIAASFISGVSSAGVIAVINYAIANLQDSQAWLPWLFIGLCLILWIFSFISWVLTTRLSQEIIYDLRLKMTQQILDCPLRHLETVGASTLLATLTGDINWEQVTFVGFYVLLACDRLRKLRIYQAQRNCSIVWIK